MKLYSYVVTHDEGFAPNPFGGVLTLATCKPRIRKSALVNDWVMGTGSVNGIGVDRLIYLAKVSKKMSLQEYGRAEEFTVKKPHLSGEWWSKHGDNIYYEDCSGASKQRRNVHHGPSFIDHDLGGEYALICKDFWYFGRAAIVIPLAFHCLIKKGPGYKANENVPEATMFIDILKKLEPGLIGAPSGL
jgi:hypothetical protein